MNFQRFFPFPNATTSEDENMAHSSHAGSVDLVMGDGLPSEQLDRTGEQTAHDNDITPALASPTADEMVFSSDDVYLTLSPRSQGWKFIKKMEFKDIVINQLRGALHKVKISWATRKHWLLTNKCIEKQEARIKKLRKEMLDQMALIDDYKSKLSDRDQQIEELKQNLHTADKKAKHISEIQAASQDAFAKTIQRLEDDIDQLKSKNKKLRKQPATTKSSPDSPQSVSNSFKVSDTAIVNLWNSMSYNIRDMATTLLTGCPSRQELHGDHINASPAIGRMSAQHFDLLQDEDTRSFVVERYIWNGILSHVFGHSEEDDLRGAWSGRVGDRFIHICRDLFDIVQEEGKDAVKFSRWKAKGSFMIEQLMGVEKWKTYEAVGPELEGWYKFLPQDKQNCRATRLSIDNALDKVYEEAVELQSMFMKSKAHFLVDWEPSYATSRYHPDMMEAEMWERDLDRASKVLFRISPFLTKIGTADGDSYDRSLVLIKQRVVCN